MLKNWRFLSNNISGRSHSVTSQTLVSLSPEEQAQILINFRAPSIVKGIFKSLLYLVIDLSNLLLTSLFPHI